MHPLQKRAYLSLVFLVSLVSTTAQESHSIAFQVFLWPGGTPPGITTEDAPDQTANDSTSDGSMMKAYAAPIIQYFPNGSGEVRRINAAERRISPVYQYTGSDPLVFFQTTTSSNGEIVHTPLAKVDLATVPKRALLLFYPKKAVAGYSVFSIDNSIENIAAGRAVVYNLTSTPVACLFNNQQLILDPGDSEYANLGPSDDFTAIVRIGSPDQQGQWRERYAQRLVVRPTDSIIALIYTKPGPTPKYRILVLNNPNEATTGTTSEASKSN